MAKQAIVIGSGFAGLSAAAHLAKSGFAVTVVEKNSTPGGRARMFHQDGFAFDMGPSWYWMPDVFERFFEAFGQTVEQHYELVRLDPSYKVIFGPHDEMSLPAQSDPLYELFETYEPGSGVRLKRFLQEAAYKYQVGIRDLVYKPGQSLLEFADWRVLKGLVQMHLLQNMSAYIRKYFKHPKLIQLLEFPVLFLGATAKETPALYSLMNYADLQLGTWYPMGGMHKLVEAMVKVCKDQGVRFVFNAEVTGMVTDENEVKGVETKQGYFEADVVIGGADYHHLDKDILPPAYSNYTEKYWDSRKLAPSSLIFYLGVDCKIPNLEHHNLFFDRDFNKHSDEIYTHPKWPTDPLFYACCPSKTDASVAPAGMENLFVLIPVAPGLKDTDEIRAHYRDQIFNRLKAQTGVDLNEHIVFERSYAHRDFERDYHAYKGNAYGLANTLGQTAVLKPSIKSKKLNNLYFTGQLTTPGPGVPPSLISGEVVAKEVAKAFNPIPA